MQKTQSGGTKLYVAPFDSLRDIKQVFRLVVERIEWTAYCSEARQDLDRFAKRLQIFLAVAKLILFKIRFQGRVAFQLALHSRNQTNFLFPLN